MTDMNTLNAESPISVASTDPEAHPKKKGLMIIGAFKLLKGTLLLVAALGLLQFIHRDLQQCAEELISKFRVDPDNRYIAGFLEKLGLVNKLRLEELSGFTFFYSALLLTEGIGLLRQKRWAEYLTVVATASFIPLEIYELHRHITWIRVLVFAINIAILAYLIFILRKEKGKHGGIADCPVSTSPAAGSRP
jgi:uncharacterized membrane protein (DUF2068 family)